MKQEIKNKILKAIWKKNIPYWVNQEDLVLEYPKDEDGANLNDAMFKVVDMSVLQKAIEVTNKEVLKEFSEKINEIIYEELLEFGCVKEDLKRKDLDSFPEPIVSIIRLKRKIIDKFKKQMGEEDFV